MHIPDGFLNGRTAGAAAVLAAAGLAVSLRVARRLPSRRVPMMGLAAAFIFAAQMLNFPIGGGTSGHLIGGVLCAVLLGPSSAVLVITRVLIVQCLVFADGGILAIGANVFNMALICPVGGYMIFRAVHYIFPGPRGRLVAVAFASWVSTVAAAIVCAGQLSLSRVAPWSMTLPAMAGVHMFIGAGEALITTLIIFAVSQARPEMLETGSLTTAKKDGIEVMAFGLLLALGLAIFVSPFCSVLPDGLDHVAEALGFSDRQARQRIVASPIPDYHIPGIHSPAIATALAGGLGTILVFVAAWVLARALVPVRGGDA